MSWFPDLGTVTMIDSGEHVRAVGWLSAKQPFPVGDVPTEFRGRLEKFARKWGDSVKDLGWGLFMGWHSCELCDGSTASGNFGVPHGDLLFVAPEMISHYVEVHRYCPPAQFVTALRESPLPGTAEYRTAVAPFRRLHELYLEQRRQEQVERAARWAHEQGGSEASIAEAGLRFFGEGSQEISDCIRRALSGGPSDRPRE